MQLSSAVCDATATEYATLRVVSSQMGRPPHSDSLLLRVEEYEQRERLNSDSVMEVVPPRPLSTFSSSEHIYSEAAGVTSTICPSAEQGGEEATYQNVPRPFDSKNLHGNCIHHDPRALGNWSISNSLVFRSRVELRKQAEPLRRLTCQKK